MYDNSKQRQQQGGDLEYSERLRVSGEQTDKQFHDLVAMRTRLLNEVPVLIPVWQVPARRHGTAKPAARTQLCPPGRRGIAMAARWALPQVQPAVPRSPAHALACVLLRLRLCRLPRVRRGTGVCVCVCVIVVVS